MQSMELEGNGTNNQALRHTHEPVVVECHENIVPTYFFYLIMIALFNLMDTIFY